MLPRYKTVDYYVNYMQTRSRRHTCHKLWQTDIRARVYNTLDSDIHENANNVVCGTENGSDTVHMHFAALTMAVMSLICTSRHWEWQWCCSYALCGIDNGSDVVNMHFAALRMAVMSLMCKIDLSWSTISENVQNRSQKHGHLTASKTDYLTVSANVFTHNSQHDWHNISRSTWSQLMEFHAHTDLLALVNTPGDFKFPLKPKF